MTSFELEDILREYHVRVCCADELPDNIKERPRTFVVNTDPCLESGSHWTVLHFSEKGPCESFDSAGNLPGSYHPRFEFVLVVNGPHYLYIPDRIQPTDSVTYCVYFLQQRYGNVSFKNIIKGFSTMRLMDNDRRVLRKTIRD